MSQIVTAVSTMTGEDNLDIVTLYVEQAKSEILSRRYPFGYTTVAPEKIADYLATLPQLIIKLSVYLLNRRGAEGEMAHSENGVSRSYENSDIPSSYFKGVIPLSKVIGGETVETATEEP